MELSRGSVFQMQVLGHVGVSPKPGEAPAISRDPGQGPRSKPISLHETNLTHISTDIGAHAQKVQRYKHSGVPTWVSRYILGTRVFSHQSPIFNL